jgi:transcriptional regulator with XRE-family HTH domain
MKIGSLIKKIRMVRGLTQVQLAEIMGITQNYLSLIETDTKIPSNEKIRAFAKHLNICKRQIKGTTG